jgi:hypothetical protein
VEDRAEKTLRYADMADIPAYYARSPSSCFSILQFGEKLIGLIALDASTDAINDTPLSKDRQLTAQQTQDLLHKKGTSSIATIRHMFAEEAYAPTGIEDDLLRYAIRRAFDTNNTVQNIRISVTPFKKTLLKSLKSLGFKPGDKNGRLGPFGWGWQWYTLERKNWKAE